MERDSSREVRASEPGRRLAVGEIQYLVARRSLPVAVVFDMDGTLLDTEQIGVRAWIAAFAEHGIEIDRATAMLPIGSDALRALEIFRTAIGGGHDFEGIQQRCHQIFHELADREGIPVKPGAKQILSYLRATGVRLGLATSTRSASALPELQATGLLEYFEAMVFGDQVQARKPSPEIYHLALARLGLPNAHGAWAVEDSGNGILAAHAAGLRIVHVPDLQPVVESVQALADIIAPDLGTLLELWHPS